MTNLRSAALPAGLALLGTIAAVTGVLPWPALIELAGRTIPILLFVLAMTLVTELADAAGLFSTVTAWLARRGAGRPGGAGRGKVWLLWLMVVVLASVSTVFLSLDTTAVLVTPVVVLLAIHARMPPLPFALTTVWLANSASLLLPVSNLTNLLAQHRLGLSPAAFAALMWAPALVGVAVPSALLWLLFRRDLRGSYVPQPPRTVKDRMLLRAAGITVLLLLPALVSGIPVAVPAGVAAAFLLVVFALRRPSVLRWSMLPWRPLLLTIGLFLLVAALHAHGLGTVLGRVSGTGRSLPSLLQLAGLGALASNGVNNLPAYLALEPAAGSPVRLAALLIGTNLGPLVTPWASLATLLWHERLKSLDVNISWGGFAVAGLLAAALTLPLAVLGLWLTSGMPG